jgi:hypothetical protein
VVVKTGLAGTDRAARAAATVRRGSRAHASGPSPTGSSARTSPRSASTCWRAHPRPEKNRGPLSPFPPGFRFP